MPFPSYRYRCAAFLALLAADLCSVNVMHAADHSNRPSYIHAQVKTVHHSLPPIDAQALPANVSLKDGNLTVDAHNSDLNQILREIAQIGGMTIEGTAGNARIFGVYGPGNPRDVLSNLLIDSGCNFIMAGNAHDGIPRELLLSAKNDGPSVSASAAAPVNHQTTPASEAPEEDSPGPGAVIHVPPSGPDDQQERVQENLQRLSHIRAQQGAQPD